MRLGVNIDHVATVREARQISEPDPVAAAVLVDLAGAYGIVCHLREDRRHIKDRDVYFLREIVKSHLNLEMAATEEMVKIAIDLKPDMVTLVPEKREEVTTEGGLEVAGKIEHIRETVSNLKSTGSLPACSLSRISSRLKLQLVFRRIMLNCTPVAMPTAKQRGQKETNWIEFRLVLWQQQNSVLE